MSPPPRPFTTTQNLPHTQCQSALVSPVVSQLHVALVLDSAINLEHEHHPEPKLPNTSSSTRARRSLLTRSVRSRPKLPVSPDSYFYFIQTCKSNVNSAKLPRTTRSTHFPRERRRHE